MCMYVFVCVCVYVGIGETQLKWMSEEIVSSEENSEKVIIFSHVSAVQTGENMSTFPPYFQNVPTLTL